jgi:hypothetical protein
LVREPGSVCRTPPRGLSAPLAFDRGNERTSDRPDARPIQAVADAVHAGQSLASREDPTDIPNMPNNSRQNTFVLAVARKPDSVVKNGLPN